jgi:hypothetical protein
MAATVLRRSALDSSTLVGLVPAARAAFFDALSALLSDFGIRVLGVVLLVVVVLLEVVPLAAVLFAAGLLAIGRAAAGRVATAVTMKRPFIY